MEFRFKRRDLERLYTDAQYTAGYASPIVIAFRNRMQVIREAPDERTFYGLKSLHYERLKGKRSHQHSMRLNDQWRLVIEFEGKGPGKVVVIIGIEDYH